MKQNNIRTTEGNTSKEVLNRFTQANHVTQQLNSILWSNVMTTKKNIDRDDAVKWFGYFCVDEESRIKSTCKHGTNDFLRSSRQSRPEHKTYEEIRRKIEKMNGVVEEIENRSLKWYSHLKRMPGDRWLRKALK